MDQARFLWELFLPALGLSVFVETAMLYALVRRAFGLKAGAIPAGRVVFAGVLATSATLPYVWFVFGEALGGTAGYGPVAEAFAWVAEAFILRAMLGLPLARALIASLACNASSYVLGLLVWGAWGGSAS